MIISVAEEKIKRGVYWTPLTLVGGCSPVTIDDDTPSECDFCWLAADTNVRQNNPNAKIRENVRGLINGSRQWTGDIKIFWDRLTIPEKRTIPTVYAVWSDLFHPKVPDLFIIQFFLMVMNCKRLGRGHTFIVLTKRPERIGHFVDAARSLERNSALSTLYMGTSAGTQKALDLRLPQLMKWPGKKVLSAEPLLERIEINNYLSMIRDVKTQTRYYDALDWVIVGCESRGSRPGRRCYPAWIEDIVMQCDVSDTPVFVKQMQVAHWLEKAPELFGRQWLQFPEGIK